MAITDALMHVIVNYPSHYVATDSCSTTLDRGVGTLTSLMKAVVGHDQEYYLHCSVSSVHSNDYTGVEYG